MTAPRPITDTSPRFPQRLPDTPRPTLAGASWLRRAVISTFVFVGLVVAVLVTIAVSVPFDAVIDATGVLEPTRRVVLRAPQAGAVDAVLVRSGDSVRAGQIVAYCDTLSLVTQRAQLRSALAVARADLVRTVAHVPIDSANKREGIAAAEVAVVEARDTELRLLDERIRRAIIRSPISGIVLTEQPERSVGAMFGEGEPVLEVADLRRWQLDVYVREQDAYRIATGDRVRAELPALQASADVVPLQARVASVALMPAVGPDARTTSVAAPNGGYRVVVPLDSAALAHIRTERLKRGYTARVKVLTDRGTMLQLLWRSIRHHASTP